MLTCLETIALLTVVGNLNWVHLGTVAEVVSNHGGA